jgi:hypothetical protein
VQPTARFVRFLQAEAADPNRWTYRRAPRRRETKSGAPVAVAQPSCLRTTEVVDRLRGQSAWLLLLPKLSNADARDRTSQATIAFLESDRPDRPTVDDPYGDAAIAPVRCAWRRAGRSVLPARWAWAPARAWLPLSARSSVATAGDVAAPSQMEQSVDVRGWRRN